MMEAKDFKSNLILSMECFTLHGEKLKTIKWDDTNIVVFCLVITEFFV